LTIKFMQYYETTFMIHPVMLGKKTI